MKKLLSIMLFACISVPLLAQGTTEDYKRAFEQRAKYSGKVYYDNSGTYVELPGVDVSAGGTFKLKRTVDFNNKDAFTSDYAVYSASGALLGEAKAVPMKTLELPVGKLGFSVTNMVGTSVLLDNLKLYVNGVGADLEIYDAKTGMLQTEPDKARDKNTAYRFSWMNAITSEKVYSIVVAYYNGDQLVEEKVVEEIKMAPGTDGVNTKIVELSAGQSVKLYARNDSKTVEIPNDQDPGSATDPSGKGGNNIAMLVVTILCVLITAGMAVVAVKLLKKPAPKAQKQEQSETE